MVKLANSDVVKKDNCSRTARTCIRGKTKVKIKRAEYVLERMRCYSVRVEVICVDPLDNVSLLRTDSDIMVDHQLRELLAVD